MRRRFALLFAVLSSLTVVVMVVPPASAVDVAAPCPFAQLLVDEGSPSRALALIEASQQTTSGSAEICVEAKRLATQAITDSAAKAAEAGQALANGAWADALGLANAALELDADNGVASDLKSSAEARRPAKSGPQETQSDWAAYRDTFIAPFQAIFWVFLGVLVGLLVIARWATTLTVRWPKLRSWTRRSILAAGCATCIGAAGLATVGVSGAAYSLGLDRWWPTPWWPNDVGANWQTWLLVGSFAVAGIALVATGVATRLRLHVEVRGSGGELSEGATSHLIALLNELGAEAPRGIEVPLGADVEALAGQAITGTPVGRVGKAFSAMRQLVLAGAPWRVIIGEEADDSIAVLVTRNGRSAGSAVIDRDALGLRLRSTLSRGAAGRATNEVDEMAGPDLHRLAAAVVVTTLAKYHYGFDGLCGATNWHSLGLHYVATTDLQGRDEQREVLARAVGYDPDNMLAQVAYRHSIDRAATDKEQLARYADWLSEVLAHVADDGRPLLDGEGRKELRRRVLHTRVATLVNLYYASGESGPVELRCATAALELITHLELPGQQPSHLARQSRPEAAAMALWIYDHADGRTQAGLKHMRATAGRWLKEPVSPLAQYNWACYDATSMLDDFTSGAAFEKDRADREVSVALRLSLAAPHPDVRPWMSKDPQLKELRKSASYRQIFGDEVRTDFLSLPPFLPYAATLRKLGLTTAEDLALCAPMLYAPGSTWLQDYVGIEASSARRLAQLGELGASIPGELADYRVEICAELLDRKAAYSIVDQTPSDLDVSELARSLHETIANRCGKGPDVGLTEAWLESLQERGLERLRVSSFAIDAPSTDR